MQHYIYLSYYETSTKNPSSLNSNFCKIPFNIFINIYFTYRELYEFILLFIFVYIR